MPENRNHALQDLDYRLALASARLRRDLGAALDRHGVPLEQWRILNLLQDGSGRSMGELAEAALLTLPTATRVIDRMVGEALVYRAPDPGDRRRVLVLLSEKGQAFRDELQQDADRVQAAMFGRHDEDWLRELLAKLENLAGPPDRPAGDRENTSN